MYSILKTFLGKKDFTSFRMAIDLLSLTDKCLMWGFQESLSSIIIPKYLVSLTLSSLWSLRFIERLVCFCLLEKKHTISFFQVYQEFVRIKPYKYFVGFMFQS